LEISYKLSLANFVMFVIGMAEIYRARLTTC